MPHKIGDPSHGLNVTLLLNPTPPPPLTHISQRPPHTCECGSKIFRPDQLFFKVTEIKQFCYFINIVSFFFNTYWYWYINLTTDGAMYPSQHFPFGAAFVCQAGKFWTHPRSIVLKLSSLISLIHDESLIKTLRWQLTTAEDSLISWGEKSYSHNTWMYKTRSYVHKRVYRRQGQRHIILVCQHWHNHKTYSC